jgi:hypothetical protein
LEQERREDATDSFDQTLAGELATPIAFGGHHFDQLAPASHEFAE